MDARPERGSHTSFTALMLSPTQDQTRRWQMG